VVDGKRPVLRILMVDPDGGRKALFVSHAPSTHVKSIHLVKNRESQGRERTGRRKRTEEGRGNEANPTSSREGGCI